MRKINPKSIRFRLIAWYVFSLGLVHLIVGAGLYQMVSARLHDEFDQRLQTYTTCLVELLPQHQELNLASVIEEMAELSALGSERYVHVEDRNGQLIYESTSLPPVIAARFHGVISPDQDRPTTIRLPGFGSWRVITRAVLQEGELAYLGKVAIPLRAVQQALGHLLFILIGVVPCVMILSSLGAWFLLNRTLHPLREVIRTAQAIQTKNFTQRLRIPQTGDEIQALAETFNEMAGRLDRSFDEMRRFITDASHELRTPLAVLRGELEIGLKTGTPSDRSQEILEACSNEISRMARLVEMLLFLSSADAEKITLDLKPAHLSPLMEEMVEAARILAEPKRIQVELTNSSNVILQADKMRLKQLLFNLIDNAVKYTQEGGRISLGARVKNGHVELFVADTGMGIESQDLSRIFDRFYRLDKSRSRAEGGYGLGLSICKWIAEAHHGCLHVESSPGKGSRFSVTLPLA